MGELATTFDHDIGLCNELLSYSRGFLLIEIRGRRLTAVKTSNFNTVYNWSESSSRATLSWNKQDHQLSILVITENWSSIKKGYENSVSSFDIVKHTRKHACTGRASVRVLFTPITFVNVIRGKKNTVAFSLWLFINNEFPFWNW